MNEQLQALDRNHLSRARLKQLRREGRLPGIVFGKHLGNRMIHLSSRDFQRWLKKGSSQIIDLSIDGREKIPVLLEGLQRDPITREWIHVDFLHVKMDEQVKTRVPIEYKGTPKGTKMGGITQIQETYVEVEGFPGDLPSSLETDIGDLDVGESLLVSDLSLPDGVTILAPPEALLVSIVPSRLDKAKDAEQEAAKV